jgi:hypothetical protein
MSRVATYSAALTVVAIILMATAAAWVGPPQSAHARAEQANKHAERNFAQLLHQGGPGVFASARFVHAECQCGRDTEDWVMIRVPPEAIAPIRRAVMKEANRGGYRSVRTLTIITSDGDLLRHHADHRPTWWKPTSLPGAQIIAVGDIEGGVYVFCEKTGTIYAMRWTV